MATIYKRLSKDGIPAYYFNITINGKRIRRFAGYSLDVAKTKLKKIEYDLTFNLNQESSSKLFDKSLSSYMDYIKTTNIKHRQVKVIQSKNAKFRDYCKRQGIELLKDVTSEHALGYMSKRSQVKVQSEYKSAKESIYKKLSPSTLNREINFIKRFFNYCIDMQWIDKNPFRVVKPFKIDNKKQRFYFTKKHLKSIFEKRSKYTDFYTFLLKTGLRSTDAFKLRKKHIDGSYLGILMSKTDDFLNIPLSESILELIRSRFKHDFIFPEVQSISQKRECLKQVQNVFSSQFVRENNINLHTFRHTYAHNMLDKGVPKEVLQTLLGHRSIKTTEIYANWVKTKELEKWVE